MGFKVSAYKVSATDIALVPQDPWPELLLQAPRTCDSGTCHTPGGGVARGGSCGILVRAMGFKLGPCSCTDGSRDAGRA